MLRKDRTKEFNYLIKEEHFYRIAIIIKKNAHERDILQLISNYDNFYEKLEWIDIILSMTALTNWETLDWKRISSHTDLTLEFLLKHEGKPWNGYYLSINPNYTIEWEHKVTKVRFWSLAEKGLFDNICVHNVPYGHYFTQRYPEYLDKDWLYNVFNIHKREVEIEFYKFGFGVKHPLNKFFTNVKPEKEEKEQQESYKRKYNKGSNRKQKNDLKISYKKSKKYNMNNMRKAYYNRT